MPTDTPYEFSAEQKAALAEYAPPDAKLVWDGFCEELFDIVTDYPIAQVFAPARTKTRKMAAHFEQFGRAIAEDLNTAEFVASRVNVDLHGFKDMAATAQRLWFAARKSAPRSDFADGGGGLRQMRAHKMGDPAGNDLIRAIAEIVLTYGGTAKGEPFVGLVRLCWAYSGREIDGSFEGKDAFLKHINYAMKTTGEMTPDSG